jgi:hypothetical protein
MPKITQQSHGESRSPTSRAGAVGADATLERRGSARSLGRWQPDDRSRWRETWTVRESLAPALEKFIIENDTTVGGPT